MIDTSDKQYTERLVRLSARGWKKFLDVQAPYRWNLRRLQLGWTLDIGCGIGRNLINLNGHGVGVDHNTASIEICRKRGLTAYSVAEFFDINHNSTRFDSLLLSHVVEHMKFDEAYDIIKSYLPFLKPTGKIVLIAPQVMGFKSDSTHVEYFDSSKLVTLLHKLGFEPQTSISFPFPEIFGRIFKYNEFCVVGIRKDPS